jgi:ribosomal protein L37AE/L43A
MPDPFRNYDAWLEAPYQRPDAPECPDCGETMHEDAHERTVDCEACGYHDGFDWDAEAERRAEAREDGDW